MASSAKAPSHASSAGAHHEKHFPPDGRQHDFGCKAAIYLTRPGASVRVRSWTPMEGSFHGFLITHGEAISISDYYTVREGSEVVYRPTCHYAYHPCEDTVLSLHEYAGKNWALPQHKRIFMDEIYEGIDELGALLMGHAKARTITDRSFRSRKRASSRRSTMRPACRLPPASWPR